jgi:glutamate 5-kinase
VTQTDRNALVRRARRIVVKVGSGVISSRTTGLLEDRIGPIVAQIADLVNGGREVVLVSSGAVAAGLSVLGMKEPKGIPGRQAAAAAGQSRLIWTYEKHFQAAGLKVAQVLLTQDDVGNRRRYLNARNTFATLLELGIVPIVNENDSVVVEEIKFGDNDTLSGLVATVVDADLLLVLSDVDGLFTANPRLDPEARHLPDVPKVTDEVRRMARGPVSREGTGGMTTKVAVAERLAAAGIPMLILDGTVPGRLTEAMSGGPVGTLFGPAAARRKGRKTWLAHAARCQGTIQVDEGAVHALKQGGRSLLPSGVTEVSGRFEMGATVRIAGPDGVEFARGLTNYGAEDLSRIRGRHTSEIEKVLGTKAYDEVVHRNNLVITA